MVVLSSKQISPYVMFYYIKSEMFFFTFFCTCEQNCLVFVKVIQLQ